MLTCAFFICCDPNSERFRNKITHTDNIEKRTGMPFFSRVFRSKDSSASKKAAKQTAAEQVPAKPKWTDAYQRTEVAPEEVQELLRGCTHELKSRGTSMMNDVQRLHDGVLTFYS